MADLALYRAKAQGRNRFSVFDASLEEAANVRNALESELRAAVLGRAFVLHYQPILDANTGLISGAEALIRWQHDTLGWVEPARFIPLAEESGLIGEIGQWVLQTACCEAATWPSHTKVAVNISAIQLRDPMIVDYVICALAQSGLPPERLELEITETALIDYGIESHEILRQFKALGLTIALDDFGTGYSSLSQLTMFPFDKIKIDRSFTSQMTSRSDCAAVIAGVLALAKSLDIATTAEGVETLQQYRLLKLAGVSCIQGYLIQRPHPAAELDFNAMFSPEENARVA
jgi:predicted signal transduction protein with EAL and GGDEF domain